MCEFVEDGFDEEEFRVVDEGVEEGVVEESEGGVGIGSTEVNIVAIFAEGRGVGFGIFFVKVAAVLEIADEGVEPCFRFHGEFGCCVEDESDVVAAEIGVFVVGGVSGEGEFGGCE